LPCPEPDSGFASDKVCQLLAHGQWFSLGTLASSTTKTGRHDISEILLKVAFNPINQIKSNLLLYLFLFIFLIKSYLNFLILLNLNFQIQSFIYSRYMHKRLTQTLMSF
jgi:hypothetical protein